MSFTEKDFLEFQKRELHPDDTFSALTDDMKANRKIINLWQDQAVHMAQISITVIFLLYMKG